jgi:transposase-like protein
MSGIVCKYCGSTNVVKYGKFEGIQRYWCKDCKRKFADNKALPYMRTPKNIVSSALSCYFGGMPLDAIQRHLDQQYGTYYSESGIYYWIIRFAEDASKRAKAFKPIVGDTWVADETVLRVGNRNVWFWDIIDQKSRFLLASHLSTSRTTKDACRLMREAYLRAGKAPKRIITDRLQAYLDGIELVFGANTKHIQSKPFIDTDSTNVIERFHGTLKDRTNVIRGFGNMNTAKLLTDAWLVHYNFFKEHESLGNIPPAQKMGIPVPFKDWEDVVREYKTTFVQTYDSTGVIRPTYYTRLTQPRKVKVKLKKHRAIPIPKLHMIKGIRK